MCQKGKPIAVLSGALPKQKWLLCHPAKDPTEVLERLVYQDKGGVVMTPAAGGSAQ